MKSYGLIKFLLTIIVTLIIISVFAEMAMTGVLNSVVL